MSILAFELACLVVVAITIAFMARARPLAEVLRDEVGLALAGLVGEATCIRFYHHYAYAPAWHARVLEVPLLVPLIWPLVVMSAREVAKHVAPHASAAKRSLVVGLLVVADASLIEVIAVRGGLWSWSEGGHLGVPLIGILGWGFFAWAADVVMTRFVRWGALAAIAVAPLATHALLVASWWAVFRWVLRGDLGESSVAAVSMLGLVATVTALRLRRRGVAIPRNVALPRIVATMLFFALLVTSAPGDRPLWMHVVAVGMPYLLLTKLG